MVGFGAKVPVLKTHNVCVLFHGASRPSESAGYFLVFYSAMGKMRLKLANICFFILDYII